MILRADPGATVAAAWTLAARSGVLRYRRALGVLRRGGVSAAIGLAALRSPDTAVLVRDHDMLTGNQLEAAMLATAAGLAARWRAGARIGVRGDGGIDFVVVLAAAGMAGVDVMPLGPRLGDDVVARLGSGLDGVVDAWDVLVREAVAGGPSAPLSRRGRGRILLLSTGTTGLPVATVRGRLGMRAMTQLADAERRLRLPSGPVLVLAPPDHGHGMTTLLAGLIRGRTIILASGMRPAEQASAAALHRVATISGVPAQLARLIDADHSVLDRVSLVASGSSRLTDELRTLLGSRGARVIDCYGTTESGTVAIEGRPLAGVTIQVDAGGDIRVWSPLGGGMRLPGDVGRIDRGRLVVEGRRGELVDSGGELVAPQRLTEALLTVPGVRDAVVTTEQDDLLGTVLIAEVGVGGDSGLDEARIRAELSQRISRVERPRRLTVRHSEQTPPRRPTQD